MFFKFLVGAIASIAGAFALSASAQDQAGNKIGAYDDRPFICGALFSVLGEVHSSDKNREVYNHYKSRFDRSFEKAKSNIRNAGGDDGDAELKMQARIDFIFRFLDQKKPETGDLLSSRERY
ncbi:hypothetical protein [Pararhizobium sp.]|uniref:hypothetical protein n=1 Tax=Pararhizobium sp. TaxID=1977563 RepID=UPI003D0AF6D4